jgi:hexosaminidase
MKKIIGFYVLFISNYALAQLHIIPAPSKVEMGKGNILLNNTTFINNADNDIALNNTLNQFKNFAFKNYKIAIDHKIVTKNTQSLNQVFINKLNNNLDNYTIDALGESIKISGNNKGIFYAFETLKQLINTDNKNNFSIPRCLINDTPRFAYRGLHLDVSRHFYGIDYVKKYIDYLATYKFNTFHWHLTDDQGWRIEIKKYPKLTKVGGCRDRTLVGRYGSGVYDNKKYCGFYTQAQIKEVVQYATDRFITVIPEIEMPGHSTAALASYSYLGCTKGPYKTMDTWGVLDDVLCAGNDSTFTFLQNVLDEVMALFPSKYVHIGGDECPKKIWKTCKACQKRKQVNNLKTEDDLQSYFIQRIEKYVNKKGKSIIGWDEILEGGLAPNATVMSWRGEEGGIEAAKQNHNVIMTPGSHCYFDHSQTKTEDSLTIGSYLPLEKVYAYEPIPAVLNSQQAKYILGAQANLWTEYIPNTKKLEYMLFPRILALSEVLWSSKANKSWSNFEARLPVALEKLKKQNINFSNAYYDLVTKTIATERNDGIYWEAVSKNKGEYNLMGKTKNTLINKTDSSIKIKINQSGDYSITQTGNGFTTSITQAYNFNLATGKKILLEKKPNEPYVGDGDITLNNGIQNTKGLARSTEFLGFKGSDLAATIEFDKDVTISSISIHFLDKNNSWIYLPTEIEILPMPYYESGLKRLPPLEAFTKKITDKNNIQTVFLPEPKTCRSVRVYAKNYGNIPVGQPGEGKPSWLFVSEIEVK